ncbi:hypothetical protein BJV82DRAFT_599296 [Fennellomyces sp. T-0311]|nr:hypothetical protein BJV82DRAFT_599296 [Fennellomyces sp. T-0311]
MQSFLDIILSEQYFVSTLLFDTMTFSSSEKGKGPTGGQEPYDEQYDYGEGPSAMGHSPSPDSEGSNNGSNSDTGMNLYWAAASCSPFPMTSPGQNLPEGESSTMQSDHPVCHNHEQCPYYPKGCCRYCWIPPVSFPSSSRYDEGQSNPYPLPRPVSPRSRSSSALKRYICPICSHAFSKRYDLIRHYHTHVPEINRPQYRCPNCQQPFFRRDSVTRHLRTRVCRKSKDKDQNQEPEKHT